jgi:hypothetical protein
VNNKTFYAALAAFVILAIVYGYYGLCAYTIHVTGSAAGLDDIGWAAAAIIAAFTGATG